MTRDSIATLPNDPENYDTGSGDQAAATVSEYSPATFTFRHSGAGRSSVAEESICNASTRCIPRSLALTLLKPVPGPARPTPLPLCIYVW
ncbi:hypothetical protein BN874_590018 [Candidatus Contendobacter odensis Run_B_J11]|uniref:Uncharacterized protein n=1 Tax=Candidatus Contendobacter odensis Run_B_J11 TaxID=1400861 RepID=A0A7U7GE70_9GAMM|nr:hypothetical protein BN874_590018 [Candidatus Contendobacter odensis Run_B_J11]